MPSGVCMIDDLKTLHGVKYIIEHKVDDRMSVGYYESDGILETERL
jgi:hypothetical protein